MSINAREDEMQHVEIYGKPALFTNWLVERSTVPSGWHCYDLRGSDRDPGRPATLEDRVGVNHAGTILSPSALKKPSTDFRRIGGKLNFLGECLTVAEFCEEHGLEQPVYEPKYILRLALPEEAELFYALPTQQDAELGAVGHVRIDFGSGGNEFWTTWWPRGGEELNSPAFKEELAALVNELRASGPLKDLNAMYSFCGDHGGTIAGGGRQNYGYMVETENYRYCLRCSPGQGDYHAYLTCFDLQVQRMNMAEQSTPEPGMTMGGM